ncbi:uncharacterized protein LOC129305112 isoform X2 [Prosopis cineraria]|uniref:uncharacterized protein LOC129305112 isoform X2 n=1 Tax=Prosopis cineraria TaxID=364024 RepID=UPI00240F635D|nr:uncharacterized protein LOC129305112 isoform X2 [Prosopis cineraria]
MATLQRSSFSFRRQGSSGRIWSTQAIESNTRNNVATSRINTYREQSKTLAQSKELKNDKVFDSTDLSKSSSLPKSEEGREDVEFST